MEASHSVCTGLRAPSLAKPSICLPLFLFFCLSAATLISALSVETPDFVPDKAVHSPPCLSSATPSLWCCMSQLTVQTLPLVLISMSSQHGIYFSPSSSSDPQTSLTWDSSSIDSFTFAPRGSAYTLCDLRVFLEEGGNIKV